MPEERYSRQTLSSVAKKYHKGRAKAHHKFVGGKRNGRRVREKANETSGRRDGRRKGPFFTAQNVSVADDKKSSRLKRSTVGRRTKRNDIVRNKVSRENERERGREGCPRTKYAEEKNERSRLKLRSRSLPRKRMFAMFQHSPSGPMEKPFKVLEFAPF